MNDETVVALVSVAGRDDVDTRPLGRVARRVVALLDAPPTLADAAVSAVVPGVRVLLVHDPDRGEFLPDVAFRVVREVRATGATVVPVSPCSDTVKRVDDAGVVIDTPDRNELRVVGTPIGYPAELVASGAVVAGTVPAGAVTIDGRPA
jgi:hypothetical protein